MPGSQSDGIDPYHLWLGIPPDLQPPSLYRLLGIEPFESNADVIDAAANRQSAYLHQIASGPNRREVQQLLTEIASARRYLLNAETKAEYDSKLHDETQPTWEDLPPLPPEPNLAEMSLSELTDGPSPPPILPDPFGSRKSWSLTGLMSDWRFLSGAVTALAFVMLIYMIVNRLF